MAMGRSPYSTRGQRRSPHISHKPLGAARWPKPGRPAYHHRAGAARRHVRSQDSEELAGGALPVSAAASLLSSSGGFSVPPPRRSSRGSRGRSRDARWRGHGTAPSPVTAGSREARALSASPPGSLALLLAGPGLLLPLLALLLAAAAAARIMSGRRCAGGGAACAGAAAEAVEPAARELFEACRNGDVERVKRLVTPEKVNSRDTAGRKSTPLHFAAGKRDQRRLASPRPHLRTRVCRPETRHCTSPPGLSPWDSDPGSLDVVEWEVSSSLGVRG